MENKDGWQTLTRHAFAVEDTEKKNDIPAPFSDMVASVTGALVSL